MKQSHFHRYFILFCLLCLSTGGNLPCQAQIPDDVNSVYFRRITDRSDMVSDAIYLFVTEDEQHSVFIKTNAYEGIGITCSPKNIYQGPVRANNNDAPYELTITKDSQKFNVKFYAKDGTLYYVLGGASGNTSLTYSKSYNTTSASWTITFDNDGYAKMYTTNNNYNLCYNPETNTFKLQTADDIKSYGYQRISIYRKEYLISIPEVTSGYATFYSNGFSYQMPNGLTGYAVQGIDSDNSLILNPYYTERVIVPQSIALLLYGNPGFYIAPIYDPHIQTSTVTNYMEGTRNSENLTTSQQVGSVEYFKLGLGPNKNKIGFYWGAENGAAFTMTKPTTAYLALPTTMTVNKEVLSLPTDPTATGIAGHTNYTPSPTDIYDLSGRKISRPRHGFYIQQGNKRIVR